MLMNAIPGIMHFQGHSCECSTSNSPKTFKRVTQQLQKFIVQEAFANLSLSDVKREAVTCLCYYLYLNSRPEAQRRAREDGSKYWLKLFSCQKLLWVMSIQETQFHSPPKWPQRVPYYPFTLPLVVLYVPSIRVVNISVSALESVPVKAFIQNPNFQKGPFLYEPSQNADLNSCGSQKCLKFIVGFESIANLSNINLPDGKLRRHPSKVGCTVQF